LLVPGLDFRNFLVRPGMQVKGLVIVLQMRYGIDLS
jgi:hypothetical protein